MLMVEAHLKHSITEEDTWNQRMAWVTAHIMNAGGNMKKRLNPTDLYKPIDVEEIFNPQPIKVQDTVTKFESKEQKEEYLKNLYSQFGKELGNNGFENIKE